MATIGDKIQYKYKKVEWSLQPTSWDTTEAWQGTPTFGMWSARTRRWSWVTPVTAGFQFLRGGEIDMKPEALQCWLTQVLLYNRRSRFNLLDRKPFLGGVVLTWIEDIVATCIGE